MRRLCSLLAPISRQFYGEASRDLRSDVHTRAPNSSHHVGDERLGIDLLLQPRAPPPLPFDRCQDVIADARANHDDDDELV